MAYVMAAPELMEAAATELATIGSTLNAARTAAAAPTLAVLPAAADEVSASIAHLFSGHAVDYQKLAGEAAAFHEQFVQRLTASAGSYASAEAANVSWLQPLSAGADVIASIPVLGPLFNSIMGYWNSLLLATSGFLTLIVSDPELLLVLPLVLLLAPFAVLASILGAAVLLVGFGLVAPLLS
ncbi:PE family protein [Mycobacterium spongiae]|uniref:PE domain-containing protein n=1 Tax=Mycobacterium spongiae TaxID=886343 RepID=A0A975JYY5_9MYCO|nr:PE family protein [Mycobacterium spongiae]QUR68281.1 PE domain-containing protein [Mycobacterium spongiae]